MNTFQSQSSPSSQDLDWTTFSLEKFSYVTSPVGGGSLQWVHDARKDSLVLVFRTIRVRHADSDEYDSRLMLSVAVGANVLENVHIGELLEVARNYHERCQMAGVDASTDPPVQVVVKSPCIAMKYPLSSTTVRRFQLRCKNESDYQRAFDVFRKLGFPLKNASSAVLAPTPALYARSLSLAPELRSISGASQLGVQKGCSEEHAPATVFPTPTLVNYRTFTSTESPFFQRPHSASSGTVRPSSAWSVESDRITRPSTAFSTSSVAFDIKSPQIPVSSDQSFKLLPPIYDPQAEKEPQSLRTFSNKAIQDVQQPCKPPAPRFISQIQSLYGYSIPSATNVASFSATNPRSGADHSTFSSEGFANFQSTTPITTRIDDGTGMRSERRISLPFASPRHISFPAADISATLDPWIPPKRDLPFPKPKEAAKRALSSTTDLSPLPKPRVLSEKSKEIGLVRPRKETPIPPPRQLAAKRVAVRANVNKSLPIPEASNKNHSDKNVTTPSRKTLWKETPDDIGEPSPLALKSAAIARPSTAPGLQSKETTNRKRAGDFTTIAPLKKASKVMIDKSTQTKTLSGRDHTAPISVSALGERSLSNDSESTKPSSPPENYLDEIDAFVTKYKNRPSPIEIWQRPGYAEASEEERHTELTNFICENLENEGFIKLCEDVGNVWQRIGLEM